MHLLLLAVLGVVTSVGAYSMTPKQYHIQTDTGPDRYFRYQTYNGQYRKEKRLDDGTVIGTYGWVDANGLLRLYDYIADTKGYRVVRQKTMRVPKITEPPPVTLVTAAPSILRPTEPSISQLIDATKRPVIPAPTEIHSKRIPSPGVPGSEPTSRGPTASAPLLESTKKDPSADVPGSEPTWRDPTANVPSYESTRIDPSSIGSQGTRILPGRQPYVTSNTRTRTRGSTKWGGRQSASHAPSPQLRPFQRTKPKQDVNTNVRRQATGESTGVASYSPGTGEQRAGVASYSPGTGEQKAGVASYSPGTNDLPAEGKFTINYDLGNQFHFEKILPDGTKVGKHGYVDPLGILRVSYYTSGPAGHTQRQESGWIGSRDPYTS
ncbi:hypothetical protein OTU49_009761 [Cherax quadricarinatus]|uniref:Cuticle protein 6 n=1 Tax=Cherax quadricarinatus TaxID=27406 RepID=A0AAW0WJI4_CHEQU